MRCSVVIFKMLALVTVLFYVLSIGGINVHTCSHTGESYVSLLVEGTSCSDIHPAHARECSCCHHEEVPDSEGSTDDCCTNDPHQLQLTGDNHGDWAKQMFMATSVAAVFPVARLSSICAVPVAVEHPDADTGPFRDILSSCCILRI